MCLPTPVSGEKCSFRAKFLFWKKVLLPSSTHIRVLMFVDSVEVERFVVDEKLCAGYTDRANPYWESIHILIRRSPVGCHQVNLDNGILNVSRIFFLHLFQQKEKVLPTVITKQNVRSTHELLLKISF